MKRVIVTGGTGFIGRHTIPYLLERGYEVHILTRGGGQGVEEVKVERVYLHSCDLFDETSLSEIIKEIRPSHLLHLAWYVEHGKFYDATENLFWVEASLRLVRIFAENGGKRVAVTGTCAEYDWSHHGLLSENGTPLKPSSRYAMAKHTLMQLLTYFSESLQLNLVWCRMFFLYGPFEQPSRLIPYIINELLNDREIKINNSTSLRDFLYIEDAAHAIVTALDSSFEGPINIASGNSYALGNIANEISKYLKDKVIYHNDELIIAEQKVDRLQANVNCLKNNIGFRSTYDLSTGIKKTIDWWKMQSK